MRAHIYLKNQDGSNGSQGKLLAKVELEVVPGGTYTIEGVDYTLTSKPTFVIDKMWVKSSLFPNHEWEQSHQLMHVVLLVEKV